MLSMTQISYISTIVDYLRISNDVEELCKVQVSPISGKVKLLNILTHIFDILPSNKNIFVKILDGDTIVVKYSETCKDGITTVAEIKQYKIDVNKICDMIISSSYSDIGNILEIFK